MWSTITFSEWLILSQPELLTLWTDGCPETLEELLPCDMAACCVHWVGADMFYSYSYNLLFEMMMGGGDNTDWEER